MECHLIEEIEKFKHISKEWDEALSLSAEDNPFLLSDFICTWWKYHSKGRKLMIFLIYDKEKIISGIPLCMTRKKARNVIEYIGGCAANITHPFLINADNAGFDFVECLFSSLGENKGWDILILDRVLESNFIAGQIRRSPTFSADGRKLNYRISISDFNGIIDLTKGYNSIFENLPERLKRYLIRGKQKASLIGELQLNKIKGIADINHLFSEFRDLSVRSFRIRNSISAFADTNYSNFFKEIIEIFERNGRLDAHRLSADNKTLGISFGYRFGEGFKWILTCFNPDFQNLRPGHLLIDFLIREAIAIGDPYFDMYYGGELFYKQQWCNRMIPIQRIEIYRNNLVNKSLLYGESVLRSNKLLINAAKGLFRIINNVRRLN